MAILNSGFETAGANPGEAQSWTLVPTATLSGISEFDTTDEHPEDFEEGWRAPQGGFKLMASYNAQTNVYTDGDEYEADHFAFRLFARVTTQFGAGDAQLRPRYTNQDGTPNRVAIGNIPANSPVGTIVHYTLEGADYGVLDVTSVVEEVAYSNAGAIDVYGAAALSWCKASAAGSPKSCQESISGLFNEDAIFAFVDATHLEQMDMDGKATEDFEAGWDNDAGLLDDFDTLVSEAAAFDNVPSGYTSEPTEDFEEGWRAPNSLVVEFGTYQIVDNTYTDGSTISVGTLPNYPVPNANRARVTEEVGAAAAVDLDITFKQESGGANKTGVVRLPAGAKVGRTFTIEHTDIIGGTGGIGVHDVSAVAEQTPVVQAGTVALEADRLPTTGDLTNGLKTSFTGPDLEAAEFDVADDTVEDFEEEWGNDDLITEYTSQNFDASNFTLEPAVVRSLVILGSWNISTNVYTDGSAGTITTNQQTNYYRVTTDLGASDVTLDAVEGGTTIRRTVPGDAVADAWGGHQFTYVSGSGYIDDSSSMSEQSPVAQAGVVELLLAEVGEMFEEGWTLTL